MDIRVDISNNSWHMVYYIIYKALQFQNQLQNLI